MFLHLLIWCTNNDMPMNNKSRLFPVTLQENAAGCRGRAVEVREFPCPNLHASDVGGGALFPSPIKTLDHWLDWKDFRSILYWINSLITPAGRSITFYHWGWNVSECKDGHCQTGGKLHRLSCTSNRMEGGFFKALCHKFFICIWLWGTWGRREGQSGGQIESFCSNLDPWRQIKGGLELTKTITQW